MNGHHLYISIIAIIYGASYNCRKWIRKCQQRMGPAVSNLHFQSTVIPCLTIFEFISCYYHITYNTLLPVCVLTWWIVTARDNQSSFVFRWFWTTEAVGAGSVVQGWHFSVSYVYCGISHDCMCYNRMANNLMTWRTHRDRLQSGECSRYLPVYIWNWHRWSS